MEIKNTRYSLATSPYGEVGHIAEDLHDNLWVSLPRYTTIGAIARMNKNTADVSIFHDIDSRGNLPTGIACADNGMVYVAGSNLNSPLWMFSPDEETFTRLSLPTEYDAWRFGAMVYDPARTCVWVNIKCINTENTTTLQGLLTIDVRTNAITSHLMETSVSGNVRGIQLDPAGKLWFNYGNDYALWRYDPAQSSPFTRFDTGNVDPVSFTFDNNLHILATDSSYNDHAGVIMRLDPQSGDMTLLTEGFDQGAPASIVCLGNTATLCTTHQGRYLYAPASDGSVSDVMIDDPSFGQGMALRSASEPDTFWTAAQEGLNRIDVQL